MQNFKKVYFCGIKIAENVAVVVVVLSIE